LSSEGTMIIINAIKIKIDIFLYNNALNLIKEDL